MKVAFLCAAALLAVAHGTPTETLSLTPPPLTTSTSSSTPAPFFELDQSTVDQVLVKHGHVTTPSTFLYCSAPNQEGDIIKVAGSALVPTNTSCLVVDESDEACSDVFYECGTLGGACYFMCHAATLIS